MAGDFGKIWNNPPEKEPGLDEPVSGMFGSGGESPFGGGSSPFGGGGGSPFGGGGGSPFGQPEPQQQGPTNSREAIEALRKSSIDNTMGFFSALLHSFGNIEREEILGVVKFIWKVAPVVQLALAALLMVGRLMTDTLDRGLFVASMYLFASGVLCFAGGFAVSVAILLSTQGKAPKSATKSKSQKSVFDDEDDYDEDDYDDDDFDGDGEGIYPGDINEISPIERDEKSRSRAGSSPVSDDPLAELDDMDAGSSTVEATNSASDVAIQGNIANWTREDLVREMSKTLDVLNPKVLETHVVDLDADPRSDEWTKNYETAMVREIGKRLNQGIVKVEISDLTVVFYIGWTKNEHRFSNESDKARVFKTFCSLTEKTLNKEKRNLLGGGSGGLKMTFEDDEIDGKDVYRVAMLKSDVSWFTLGDLYKDPDVQATLLTEGVDIPVVGGIDLSAGDIFMMDFADVNSLVLTGKPRMGKSNWAQTIIAQICMFKSPEEVQFQIFDAKGSSGDFGSLNLPHFSKDVPGETAQGVMQKVQDMVSVYEIRKHRLAKYSAKNLDEYNELVDQGIVEDGEKLPYIYILMDEFSTIYNQVKDEGLHKEFTNQMKVLIRTAPYTGFKVIVIPHLARDSDIPGALLNLFDVRTSMNMTINELERMFVEKSKIKNSTIPTRAGECLIDVEGATASKQGMVSFKVALLIDADPKKVGGLQAQYNRIAKVWEAVDSSYVPGMVNFSVPTASGEDYEDSAEIVEDAGFGSESSTDEGVSEVNEGSGVDYFGSDDAEDPDGDWAVR